MTPIRAYLPALGLAFATSVPISAQPPIRLQETSSAGYEYHVTSRVNLSGGLVLPQEKDDKGPRTLAVTGTSAIDYDERIVKQDADGTVSKTARIYRRVDFERKVGQQPQQNTI